MFIQEFYPALRDFKDLTPQAANDTVRRQQVIALDAILIGRNCQKIT